MNLNGFLSMSGNVSGSLGADLVVDVEANPSGVATQPLIKLRVGDVIYGIPTGGGGGGTSDYNLLTNKPKINGVILQDELSLHSLGIQEEITFSGEATEYLNGEGVFTTPPFYVPINYDTAEQNTGIKWIDGKDIFVKTVITSPINTTGRFTWQWGIDNIDSFISINALYHQSNNRVKVLDGYNGTVQDYGGIIFDIIDSGFTVQIGSQILGGKVYCTVYYTKIS